MDRVPVAEINSHGMFHFDNAKWFSQGPTVDPSTIGSNPEWKVKACCFKGEREGEIALLDLGLLVEPLKVEGVRT